MRVIVFFINLWLVLLSGGHSTYAETHDNTIEVNSTHHYSENKSFHFSSKTQTTTIIEIADFDLEEEYTGSSNVKESNNKGSLIKDNLINGPTSSVRYILHSNAKGCKTTQPFYDYSSPIYIKNRVLRI